MEDLSGNKKKIINDPVHGFITITNNILHDIIEHPYYQRLRRIKQLGLTHLVYPGAMHTRFQHGIGAMFLMDEALKSLHQKKHEISAKETKAAKAAILMHDIGHGPFSHALEHSIVEGITHEEISMMMMQKLNQDFEGKLEMAIDIFQGRHSKHFLSQLISSQLDVDRMDYVRRDSFFTGVSEGVIGTQRILKMLNVKEDALVVEEKGIYSIDNFLNSRRIMYWQVYLHKTSLSAEFILIHILKRAKELAKMGSELFASPAFSFFLYNQIGMKDFKASSEPLEQFAKLDDFDILTSVKVWQNHEDKILSDLCKRLINRNLFKMEISENPIDRNRISRLKEALYNQFPFTKSHPDYYVFSGSLENHFYDYSKDNIRILLKTGEVMDLSKVSDQWKNDSSNFITEKQFICYPKTLK